MVGLQARDHRALGTARGRRVALAGERRLLDRRQPARRRRGLRRVPRPGRRRAGASHRSSTVWGVGLRIGRTSRAAARHRPDARSRSPCTRSPTSASRAVSGGAQVQFTNLAVSAAGAQRRQQHRRRHRQRHRQHARRNPPSHPPSRCRSTATTTSRSPCAPATATGPWWIAIQKGFGPLYLEQVGLGVVLASRRVDRGVGVPRRLGVAVRPHLRRRRPPDHLPGLRPQRLLQPRLVGDRPRRPRSLGRHGRAVASPAGCSRTSSRAPAPSSTSACCSPASASTASPSTAGTARASTARASGSWRSSPSASVVGPIGGPPAFFLTGIGGGFGINRELVVPTDLSTVRRLPAGQGARRRGQARATRWRSCAGSGTPSR